MLASVGAVSGASPNGARKPEQHTGEAGARGGIRLEIGCAGVEVDAAVHRVRCVGGEPSAYIPRSRTFRYRFRSLIPSIFAALPRCPPAASSARRDRKSTRLNSSHL